MEIRARNVNQALLELVYVFYHHLAPISTAQTRTGLVASIDEPVIVTYERPWECVLFNKQRDANPFFHLFEALWMLAGRDDVASLAFYSSKIGEVASDDGKTFNGAYGYRWREAIEGDRYEYTSRFDQLEVIADHLRKNPNSRRAVLQMWNVEDDLLKVETTKDCCCNTHIYFSIRERKCLECDGFGILAKSLNVGSGLGTTCPICSGLGKVKALDMTVCNRSNDLLWGMLGANVVHFAFLQEYMAARIGVAMGFYRQITNNLHVYTGRKDWQPEKLLKEQEYATWYQTTEQSHINLVKECSCFDKICSDFVDNQVFLDSWEKEPFFSRVAFSMCWAFNLHKKRKYDLALNRMEYVEAKDWRIAGTTWILKRKEQWEKKNG